MNYHGQVIIQGITGKEGERVARFMLSSGANVVAGVRPGKGGQEILGLPVYNSVADASQHHAGATISCVYVPPQFVLDAALEAIGANMEFLHIIGEGVPVKDAAKILAAAKQHSVQVLGPSSLGVIIPGTTKIGSIGGEDNSSFSKGSVGIISRSGGMASELANILTMQEIGQSKVIHVGGDYLVGISPVEAAMEMQQDENTKVIIMIGEVGGSYEYGLVDALEKQHITKPVIVFLSGQFVESLPRGVALGHAGAIIQTHAETRNGKTAALLKAGARVVEKPDQIVALTKEYL